MLPTEPVAPTPRPALDALTTVDTLDTLAVAVVPWPSLAVPVTLAGVTVVAVVVMTLVLVVEALAALPALAVVVRVVAVVAVVVGVAVVAVGKLVLQRRSRVQERPVGSVLADGGRGKAEKRENLLPVACQRLDSGATSDCRPRTSERPSERLLPPPPPRHS